jgi:hypothetical protein
MRLLKALLLLFMAVPAAAAPFGEKWTLSDGTILEAGDLDGDPALEFVVGLHPDGRILIVDALDGTPITNLAEHFGDGATALISVINLDTDDANEILIFNDPPGPPVVFGLLEHDGMNIVPRWERFNLDGVQSFTGASFRGGSLEDVLVAFNGDFQILDGATGQTLYQWSAAVSNENLDWFQLGDFDGDGYEEVLTFSTNMHGMQFLRLVESTEVAAAPHGGYTTRVVTGNAPNPFTESTSIQFALPQASTASVRVFDIAGRLVRTLVDQPLEAGSHVMVWDGRDGAGVKSPSGVYFYEVEAAGQRVAKRMLRLR